MVNMNKFRYLRIFTLGLHSLINRTFHPVCMGSAGRGSILSIIFIILGGNTYTNWALTPQESQAQGLTTGCHK